MPAWLPMSNTGQRGSRKSQEWCRVHASTRTLRPSDSGRDEIELSWKVGGIIHAYYDFLSADPSSFWNPAATENRERISRAVEHHVWRPVAILHSRSRRLPTSHAQDLAEVSNRGPFGDARRQPLKQPPLRYGDARRRLDEAKRQIALRTIDSHRGQGSGRTTYPPLPTWSVRGQLPSHETDARLRSRSFSQTAEVERQVSSCADPSFAASTVPPRDSLTEASLCARSDWQVHLHAAPDLPLHLGK